MSKGLLETKLMDRQSNTFGKNVKNARSKLKVSLDKVSEATGFSKSYLWQVEKGEVHPTIYKADDICRCLGISIKEAMTDGRI